VSASVFLGLDCGTSGVRASCVDADGLEIAQAGTGLEPPEIHGNHCAQNPEIWKQATFKLIEQMAAQVTPKTLAAIAIDGTSSTVLLCDSEGNALSPALMYNDLRSTTEAALLAQYAPADCAVHGAGSSLAKALYLLQHYPEASHICHQADWLAASLSGHYDISDENNCLKLGYDAVNQCWPAWIKALNIPPSLFPRVQPPGTVASMVTANMAEQLGLTPGCLLVSGTTDSVAALIAAGASNTGDAVTSLGSTLVLKVISDKPVFAPEYGIYSHRLNNQWLVGGASNSGGRVLDHYFSKKQLNQMMPYLHPERSTGLDYYPLPATGERFPLHDPQLQSRLTPRPDDDVEFFQGILEGIARIEAEGYRKLEQLGAARPVKIITAGGGACNVAWSTIRQQMLGVPVTTAEHSEASYGAALLARQGYLTQQETT